MAIQVVTNPQTGTITGVQNSPTNVGTISGVTQANPGTISGVTSSPTGTSNYNPQATAPTQVAAGIQTVMPNTTQGGVTVQPASNPADLQTYSLGDGSVWNSNGTMVSGPTKNTAASAASGQAQSISGPVGMNTPTPDTTTDSTSLTNNTGYGDIMSMLNKNLNNLDTLFSNLSAYSTVGQQEQDQQKKVASDQAAMTGLGYQAQGLYNPDNQAIALPFLTGQAQNKLVGAGIQSQLDQSVLNYMQGNRQFAFNSAATMFDAGQKNLQTMLDVYSKAAPQNIGTNYNPTTGLLTAIMRNPLTGETYAGSLGNIGAQKQFTSTNIATDPLTGSLTFVGTTSDGKVVQQPIGGGGFNSSSVSSPLSGGNFTQTSNPQVTTTGELLGNWTSGQATQLPGAGYQQAVYQTFGKLTGQQIDANTPTSTLVSNIPAMSQAIATAEGYGKANNVGTRINNPGNILWANQPNATPYTSSNGYTYAKFNTEQDGYNAMNNLLAKKLGATPQTAPASGALPTSADIQPIIKSLPPAVQGAFHYLPDNTAFINGNQLTAAQIPMAQGVAARYGVPYVNGTDADKLDNTSVALQNLNELTSFIQSNNNNANLGLGKAGNWLMNGPINSFFGSTKEAKINEYRQLAIDSLKALVGGTGSGLRITASEIASQQDNIPNWLDTPGQAQTKADALSSQLNKWTSQILPGWKPTTSAAASPIDFTATLNNLAGQR